MHRQMMIIVSLALTSPLGACRKDKQPPAAAQQPTAGASAAEPEQRAREAIKALGGALKKELMQAMQRGPDKAIQVCKTRAPQIARELSTGGLVIGRTSHRVRNPDNRPRRWVVPLLEAMRETPPKAGELRTAELEGGKVLGVVQPILAAPLCLTCHGKELAPPIAAAIKQAYPEDQATGFSAGELRGVFWVEVSR
jgi:hypothetical protein